MSVRRSLVVFFLWLVAIIPPVRSQDTFKTRAFRVAFFDAALEALCDGDCGALLGQPGKIRITLMPAQGLGNDAPRLLELHADTAIVEFQAAPSYAAALAVISRTDNGRSVTVRVLAGAGEAAGQPNVVYSMRAPELVRQSFGERIAARYLVVDVAIRNPGPRRLLVRKSAIHFDADFTDAAKQEPASAPERAGNLADPKGAVYRCGIEHNYKLSPEDLFGVLGVFDAIGGRHQSSLRVADLLVSLASALATTGTVSGSGYARTVNLASGIVLPRAKDIFMSPENEKRRRNNLLQQSFGDTISVGPMSSAGPVALFLPRRVIDKAFPKAVVVRQIRDVHLEADVIADTAGDAVVKGVVKAGMTRDQVIQAVGYYQTAESADGRTVWRYAGGAYESVTLNAEGLVVEASKRAVRETP